MDRIGTTTLGRRTLLAGAAAAPFAVSPIAAALAAEGGGAADEWNAAFESALAADRRLIGWRGDAVEVGPRPVAVEGRMPAGLSGTFYRNGPGAHVVGGRRYHHWFDGDGLVQAWRIGDDGVDFRARFVATRKRLAEQAAGRPLVPGFGTVFADAPSTVPADAMNPANISVLPLAGALLALWEAGSAYDLDPETLATLGPRVWRPDLAGLPFSAHPKIDPDGTVWNFGSAFPDGRLMVWRIATDGRLAAHALLDERFPGMLHDMAMTERHLLFLLPPFRLDPAARAGASFLDAHRWEPAGTTRAIAVSKDELRVVRRWDLPAGFGFHFGNAWEEADGTIRFDHARSDDPGLLTALGSVMRGRRVTGSPPRLTRYALHPDGRVEIAALAAETAEFPRLDARAAGRRARHLFHLAETGGAWWFDAVVRRDGDGAEVERFAYAPGLLAEEHLFVPRPGGAAEGDGWLLGSALDTAAGRTGLFVFEATRLADGPLAVAWLDTALPLGLHAAWV